LWGLVIADVADKGMPAALFMAMCRTLLRAAAMSRTSPSETLTRVNELLFSDSRTDLFVTVFYAIWDPTTHLFKYACAGHNPPIHIAVGKRRKLQELGAKGIALGVLPNISLEEKSLILKPQDIIFAYTDGVTEAMTTNHEEWGMQRLRKVLQKSPVEVPAHLAASVVESVEKFVGDAPQSDDLTLWVLKRR
jgi:sigma-B regulation protein RsbU (phosphoserine phosphatase)